LGEKWSVVVAEQEVVVGCDQCWQV